MKRKLPRNWYALLVAVSLCFAPGLMLAEPSSNAVTEFPPPLFRELINSKADVNISGKISDEAGQPLPGANVLVKGTTIGTTTDANGEYKLAIPEGSNVLVFSFIGYKTQE